MYCANPSGNYDQTTCSNDEGTKQVDQLELENEVVGIDDNEPIARRLRKRVCKNSASNETTAESLKGRPRASKKACKVSVGNKATTTRSKGSHKTSSKNTYKVSRASCSTAKSLKEHSQKKAHKDSINSKGLATSSKRSHEVSSKNKQKGCTKEETASLEVTESFSYHQDLKPVFGNTAWIEILQEIYGVWINAVSDCELNISGPKSSVASVVSAMEELTTKYSGCSDKMHTADKNQTEKLASALKLYLNKDTSLDTLDGIPDSAITSLLSSLAVTYKENFPLIDNSPSLDDSVMVLNISAQQQGNQDNSVIILDSDSDASCSFQQCSKNPPPEIKVNIKTEKHDISTMKPNRNIGISLNTFHSIPDNIISLISSLLEKAHEENKENISMCDSSTSLEDSVVIIDTPQKKTKTAISAFVLDDDSGQPQRKNLGTTESLSKRGTYVVVVLQSDDNLQKNLLQQSGQLQVKKPETPTKGKKLNAGTPNCISAIADGLAEEVSQCTAEPQMAIQHPAIPAQPAELPLQPPAQCDALLPQPPVQQSMVHPPLFMNNRAARTYLRPVIIDGSNVALYITEGKPEEFSWKRIHISTQYFLDRGHDVKVFLPHHRRALCYEIAGKSYIEKLEREKQLLVFTPSRKINGKIVSCYDDRFIVDFAHRSGGVILSNDNYRDLMVERPDWKITIHKRLLMYIFVGDEFMIPEDPLGRGGPNLDKFLSFPQTQKHNFYRKRWK